MINANEVYAVVLGKQRVKVFATHEEAILMAEKYRKLFNKPTYVEKIK
tara:strand:- start:13 stop:156 length:144 start_codon:yes stop_codon:yes gene_type:complete